jgi:hypothetical protein
MPKVNGNASDVNGIAVTGKSTGSNSTGVLGVGEATGVRGESKQWHAVIGVNNGSQGFGVYGFGNGTGVAGESTGWIGVFGKSTSAASAGVHGEGQGPGVVGVSAKWHGVYGETTSTTGGAAVWGENKGNGPGVVGVSNTGQGVIAKSNSHEAINAVTHSMQTAAIAAYNSNAQSGTAALYAKKEGTAGHAGFFEGNVFVSGEVYVKDRIVSERDVLLMNADCAEDFDVACITRAMPGTVMVLKDDGALDECAIGYDTRVVGVVSGAGKYKPALVLDKQADDEFRRPIALMGKVYCKVDARPAAIARGDLLTTCETPGHAMKARDATRAFGAVIGKALAPLESGTGLIPVLIALQ